MRQPFSCLINKLVAKATQSPAPTHSVLDIDTMIKSISTRPAETGIAGISLFSRPLNGRKRVDPSILLFLESMQKDKPNECGNKEGKRKHIYPRKARTVPIRLIGLSVLVLLLTNLKGLASLQRSLSLRLALLALQTQHQLLGLLGLHRYLPFLRITFLWKIGLV